MKKIIFENAPSMKTPLSAENLNKLQDNMDIAIKQEVQKAVADASNSVKVIAVEEYTVK